MKEAEEAVDNNFVSGEGIPIKMPNKEAIYLEEILVGCAGWSLHPRIVRDQFPDEGSLLQRYAAKLPIVEINSSFYRPHRAATYAR